MLHVTESHLLIFLLQVLILLGAARILGLLFSHFGQPTIAAEIIVGIVLGPTILERISPELHQWLFPDDHIQHAMLQSVSWLGMLFFLLVSGLDTDFSSVWRQKKHASLISLASLVIPMIIPFAACMLLPSHYLLNDRRVVFAMFVATILTISALPVTARVLQELGIYKTDLGLLIMSVLTINDVTGWIIFAMIFGASAGEGFTFVHMGSVLAATLLFTGVMLTVGRGITHRIIKWMHEIGLPEPGTSLTFICLLGLLGGEITLRIGIHALFGFFIAGIVAGDSSALSENTRHVIIEMVRAILVPLFFAAIGLQIDFIADFDPILISVILIVGISGRYAGAWMGAVISRQPREHRHLISISNIPGGEMQIVVGLLAMEYHIISEKVFVAIVCGAIISSILMAPWMKRALSRRKTGDILRYFAPDLVMPALREKTRDGVIRELARAAAAYLCETDSREIYDRIQSREEIMGTALEHGVAVPHARLPRLEQPLVIVGRSDTGIEWNSSDGMLSNLIYLILTPKTDQKEQVKILRAIAIAMRNQTNRKALRDAGNREEMWHVLNTVITDGG